MPRDPAVEQLLADHTDDVVRTAQRLREVLLEAQPELVERARTGWHSVNYAHPRAGFVCALFPGSDRVDLVFEHGARLPDPEGRLTGTGRQVRTLVVPAGAAVDAPVVTELLDLAVELGVARSRRPRSGSARPAQTL
jgi:hypothetical protein